MYVYVNLYFQQDLLDVIKDTRMSSLHLMHSLLYSQHTVAAAIVAAVPNSPPQNPYAAPLASVCASPLADANLVAPGISAQSNPFAASAASVPYPLHFEVNLATPVTQKYV